MAKKSKKSKKSRGRRRIGAALNPNSPIVKLMAVAGGYFLGDTINPQIDKIVKGKISDKMVGVGQSGLGGLLLMSRGGGKYAILKTLAGGVLGGSGLKRALVAFNIVKPSAAAAIPPPSTVAGSLGYNQMGRVGYNGGASRVGRSVAGMQGADLMN